MAISLEFPHQRSEHARDCLPGSFHIDRAGCILFALVLLDRLLHGYVISVEGTNSLSAVALTTFYWIGETFAVLTVSAGLLLPSLAFHLNHGAFGIRARFLLLQIAPIWTRVATGQDQLILAKPQQARRRVPAP
ncbi:hypothetical protein [Pseudarthrobacter sulfonivorans]|uniref:hypothetical protein n=1 Tax=Pseudarthrobacter sulfonivorans TaxID=121292 RepID=UPI00168A69D4|nr:hypothetical protein [Pseudarthrobacter sulfonivorans]